MKTLLVIIGYLIIIALEIGIVLLIIMCLVKYLRS
jgi:hypothetical protein